MTSKLEPKDCRALEILTVGNPKEARDRVDFVKCVFSLHIELPYGVKLVLDGKIRMNSGIPQLIDMTFAQPVTCFALIELGQWLTKNCIWIANQILQGYDQRCYVNDIVK